MTLVRLRGRVPGFGQLEALASGTIAIERWSGEGSAASVIGPDYIPDTVLRTAIIDGAPAEPLDLLPTDETFCIRWTIVATGADHSEAPLVRFTSIPSSGEVDFGDLPDVDPSTFTPLVPLPPSAQQVLAGASASAAAAAADATKASTARTGAESAKTAAETARSTATGARDIALQAKTDAQAARDAAASSAQGASNAETGATTSAGNAASSATAAAGSATAAAASATDAASSKTAASNSAGAASTSASSANDSATAAASARIGAETARTGAEAARAAADTAKLDAQVARTGAETARTGAEAARTDAESARTGAQAARAGAEAARDIALAGQFAGSDLGTAHLDTITTPGKYRQSSGTRATIAQGYPEEGSPLDLTVGSSGTGGSGLVQRGIVSWRTGRAGMGEWLRTRFAATDPWGPWRFSPIVEVDQAVGRVYRIYDHVNARMQMIHGDTGRRVITAMFTDSNGTLLVTNGAIILRRVGQLVSLEFGNVAVSGQVANSSYNFPNAMPAGFRPATSMRLPLAQSTGIGVVTVYANSAQITLQPGTTATLYQGSLVWFTNDPWPTAAPGAADGIIPAL